MAVDDAVRRTLDLLEFATQHFKQEFSLAEISFDQRGKTAGSVRFSPDGRTLIRYNRQLLLENTQEFLQCTVPHEVAHLVAFQKYGAKIRPHGPQWRAVMQLFNADASRCHNYDVTRVTTRQYARFSYRCACRSHELTSIRHKRVLNGQRYICRQCGHSLRAEKFQ